MMAQKFINWLLFTGLIALISILAYRFIAFRTENETTHNAITVVENMEVVESEEREKLQAIVKDYIMNNPEIIIDSIEQLQKRKIHEIESSAVNYIENKKAEIEDSSIFPTLGNVKGDITIVSFYDYNCGYCKTGEQHIIQLLESDSKVGVILRPFPILNEASLYAAKAMIALYKILPEKFVTIHNNLMQTKTITPEIVNQLCLENGVDLLLLEVEMSKPEIQDMLDKTFEIANNLKIHGVPAYIVNGKLLSGMVEFGRLQSLISEIRSATAK